MSAAAPRLKHFLDSARCVQPFRRVRQFLSPQEMPRFTADEWKTMQARGFRSDVTGEIDWNRLAAHGPRVWIASTKCGLGFHGEGEFPHEWLRCGFGWNDPVAAEWCPTCLGEKWGIMPADREFGEPNLRAEFEAWSEANERRKEVG